MADRNKIATTLSPADLERFNDELSTTPRLTLERIAEIAATYGVEVSLMGARSFKNTTFKRHMERLAKAGELAEQVAALRQAGAGHTIADAAAAIISDEVMAALVNRDYIDAGTLDLDGLSKIVARLRSGDAQIAALQFKITAFEKKEAERAEQKKSIQAKLEAGKKSKGGLTKETISKIEEELGLL